VAEWVDLLDPGEDELRAALPVEVHPAALRRLLAAPVPDQPPRPGLDAHDGYVFGVVVVAVSKREEHRLVYQEIDLVLTPDALLTVRKTLPGERPFDVEEATKACNRSDPAGMIAYHLVDHVAEGYLDLVDDLVGDIDAMEDKIESREASAVRHALTTLRHEALHVRRTLGPTRDAVHKVVDGRLELEGADLFPQDVQLHFADAYDKLLRATESLDLLRDLVAGVRDYAQATIAIDQNEVMKRLTVIAALFLPPTFIVGVYGQNFRDLPELRWHLGYLFSWAVIVAITVAQLVWFRRRRWV
jgi:magnesium transporter